MRISDWSSDVCSSDLLTVLQPAWPTLRIAFRSQQRIFNPLETGMRHAVVYPCNDHDRDWNVDGLGSKPILWRSRVVDQEVSQEIAKELSAKPGSQAYEVFIHYDNWERSEKSAPGDHINLLPHPETGRRSRRERGGQFV